jgi:CRP/FNR family transcriptional regulator, cyclic AMP receptor protein
VESSPGLLQRPAKPNVIRVADFDPDLFSELGDDRGRAEDRAVARQVKLEPGDWSYKGPGDASSVFEEARDERGSLGLLVLDGLLWRETCIGNDSGVELVGPGDLLRPWVRPIPDSELLAEGSWTVLRPSSVAVLDRRFAIAVARWPSITARLIDRTILRSRWLTFLLAICHVRNLKKRVLLVMWHFGDRWGRMSSTGVIVPLRLPHRMLAQLVGARRPSVTTALAALKEEGLLVERDDGSWLLPGEIPDDLRVAYEQASTAVAIEPPLDG